MTMLPLRNLRWTNRLQFTEKRSISPQNRYFSRGIGISSWRPTDRRNHFVPCHTQWSSTPNSSPTAISSITFVPRRLASTGLDRPQSFNPHSAADAVSLSNPATSADSAPLPDPISDFTSSSLESIITGDSPQVIGESLGFLKRLGLDYGWGPTAFVEAALETVHVYIGTPWWTSILLTALALRVAFFTLYVNAADTAARQMTLRPLTEPIKQRIDAAKHTQDMEAVKMATIEMRQLYKAADIKLSRMFLPILVQGPIGYGTFRLLKGMAALPVPGMDEGGLLWLKDLTVSDPYLILPMVTGFAFFWTVKKGGETGSNAVMQSSLQKGLLYGIPPISTLFMLPLPAALQLSFAFTSMMSLIQSHCFRQPWFREMLGIHPLPAPAPATPTSESPYKGTITIQGSSATAPEQTPAPKGIIEGALSDIKGAVSQVMKTARSLQKSDDTKKGTQRLTPAELKRAQAYEVQKQREIAQEKLEARRRNSQRDNR